MSLIKYSEGILVTNSEVMQKIADFNKQKKEIDKLEKQLKRELLDAMELYDIKKIENQYFTVTYIEPHTTTKVDVDKMVANGLYHEYTKDVEVKSSIRMKYKEV